VHDTRKEEINLAQRRSQNSEDLIVIIIPYIINIPIMNNSNQYKRILLFLCLQSVIQTAVNKHSSPPLRVLKTGRKC